MELLRGEPVAHGPSVRGRGTRAEARSAISGWFGVHHCREMSHARHLPGLLKPHPRGVCILISRRKRVERELCTVEGSRSARHAARRRGRYATSLRAERLEGRKKRGTAKQINILFFARLCATATRRTSSSLLFGGSRINGSGECHRNSHRDADSTQESVTPRRTWRRTSTRALKMDPRN